MCFFVIWEFFFSIVVFVGLLMWEKKKAKVVLFILMTFLCVCAYKLKKSSFFTYIVGKKKSLIYEDFLNNKMEKYVVVDFLRQIFSFLKRLIMKGVFKLFLNN